MFRFIPASVLSCVMACVGVSARAEAPMTGAEFEAFAKGRTLTFGAGGQNYGVERYLPDRKVIWSFLDGQCEFGYWYEAKDAICFVYDFEPDPQCWAMYVNGSQIRAEFLNDPAESGLYQVLDNEEELICNNFGS